MTNQYRSTQRTTTARDWLKRFLAIGSLLVVATVVLFGTATSSASAREFDHEPVRRNVPLSGLFFDAIPLLKRETDVLLRRLSHLFAAPFVKILFFSVAKQSDIFCCLTPEQTRRDAGKSLIRHWKSQYQIGIYHSAAQD